MTDPRPSFRAAELAQSRRSNTRVLAASAALVSLLIAACFFSSAMAQDVPPGGQMLQSGAPGVQLSRQDHRLFVRVDSPPADRSIRIPRIHASLVKVHFLDEAPHEKLVVHPEPREWFIRWQPDVPFRNVVVLEFDGPPLLAHELTPVRQAGDGTLTLYAHQAMTTGEKLRYEPQPHKNTIGYWTISADHATWTLHIERPGEFNVGILQGCGKDQGGSEGLVIVEPNDGSSAGLEFTTVDTGHFQNFIWRHLGRLRIEKPGECELQIKPKRIAKGALMDVRMLHLSPVR